MDIRTVPPPRPRDGLLRAMEVVGERWALLVVGHLLDGPRRFTDLHRGPPRIPGSVLAARLRSLEEHGIVRRRALPRPAGGVGYELTDAGGDLGEVVRLLDRWGDRRLAAGR